MTELVTEADGSGAARFSAPDADRGQATVELVLLLPVVVLFVLAVVQVAMVVSDRLLLAHAAREAARVAAVEPTVEAAAGAASAATSLDADRLSVQLGGQRSPGQRLTITVRYRSATRAPLIGGLVGDVDLETTVTVRIE